MEKELPHSLEAEKSLLSCFLLSPDSFAKAIEESLKENDFYSPINRQIFIAIFKLYESHRPIDIVTLTQVLRDYNQLEAIGGPIALSDILNQEFSAAHASHYTKIITNKIEI